MNLNINDKPIAVYNAETKALVGIFRHNWLVIRYLFGANSIKKSINCNLVRKAKILRSLYPAKVALRYANEKQASFLEDDKLFFINDDSLLKFDERLLAKFYTSRAILTKQHCGTF